MTQPRIAAAAPVPAGNGLAKAMIINTVTGAGFPVMYNPEELRLEQGNAFAEIAVPGLNASPVQFIRGKARTLAMDLFFDTYETGEDVRTHTAPIVGLLDTAPQTLAPPVLLFSMGRLQFQCVLVDAGQRFTMFLRDGTPVRSTVSVKLQEFVRLEMRIEHGIFFGSPVLSGALRTAAAVTGIGTQTIHTVLLGDTRSALAAVHLGDPGRWREIAEANSLDNPFDLTPGQPLVIPTSAGGGATAPGRGQP
jgi:nucleoid-associated protein YgaU